MRASLCIGSLIFVPFLCTGQQMPTWSSIVAGNVAEIELMDAGAANEDATTGQRLFGEDLLEREAITDASARLLHAARYGYMQEVLSLVNAPGIDADTLHDAAITALRHLQNDVAAALIDSGMPLDDGMLHAAASGNSPGIVRRLLALGADPNAVVEGRTPVESWWARARTRDLGIGGDYVLHELIDAGASVGWLCDHQSQLNPAARTLLRSGGENCASAP